LSKYGPQTKSVTPARIAPASCLPRLGPRAASGRSSPLNNAARQMARRARNSGDFVARTVEPPYSVSMFAIVDIDKTAKRLVTLVDDRGAR
jgi:hypothetical protein